MTILFIINGHSSAKEGISGGEIHTTELINRLVATKNTVCICCPSNYRNVNGLKNVTILTYPSIPFEEKTYKIFALLFFVYCYRIVASALRIRKLKPDMIVAGSHFFYDVLPTFFAVTRRTKLVTYIHHIIGEQNRRGVSSLVNKFLEKVSFYILKSKASGVFVYSTVNKNALVNNYGFDAKNVYMFKNGIELSLVNSIKGEKEVVYDLCFCGRLNRTKGIYDLVTIIQLVKTHIPNILCAVIGEGPEKAGFEKAIRVAGLEHNIRLLGHMTRREVIRVMKSSRLFVLPSHEEGWGIVIGEAMASGIPAIVYSLKDITEIWQDNVFWIRCFRTNDFAGAVIRLLKDKTEREFYSQKGLNFVKTLDWDVVIKDEIDTIVNSVRY